jgi:hypothetical protein
MVIETRIEGNVRQNDWNVATQALLAGFAAWNALLWLSIDVGRNSTEFPTGAAVPTAWVVAFAIISYLLLRRELKAGYVLTVLTALLAIVAMALIAVGPHGPPPGEPAAPALFMIFGPGGYVGFAVVMTVTAILAWRGRGEVGETDSADQATA